jgi:hypothetical protein
LKEWHEGVGRLGREGIMLGAWIGKSRPAGPRAHGRGRV